MCHIHMLHTYYSVNRPPLVLQLTDVRRADVRLLVLDVSTRRTSHGGSVLSGHVPKPGPLVGGRALSLVSLRPARPMGQQRCAQGPDVERGEMRVEDGTKANRETKTRHKNEKPAVGGGPRQASLKHLREKKLISCSTLVMNIQNPTPGVSRLGREGLGEFSLLEERLLRVSRRKSISERPGAGFKPSGDLEALLAGRESLPFERWGDHPLVRRSRWGWQISLSFYRIGPLQNG